VRGRVPGHQVKPVERLAEFVQSLVDGSPGFADVPNEGFAGRSHPVEARGFEEGEGISGSGEPGEIQPVATSKYYRS